MDDDPEVPLEDIERLLLGASRTLTREQVAEKAGVPIDVAEELWSQLGFPHADDDDKAFTRNDVKALKMTNELMALGILEPDSQAALVRTWGRSFARLAEWQVGFLASQALADDDPGGRLDEMLSAVVPKIARLQDYVWRRHLVSAAERLLPTVDATGDGDGTSGEEPPMAVVFCDIVGYTSQSKNLDESELVELVERFEDETARAVVAVDGRIIKTIGDEVLFVVDNPRAAVEVALTLADHGEDAEHGFPRVRAGMAFGPVTRRLGDVYGPTVNIASRLTSIARPGTVLVDRGAFDSLTGDDQPPDTAPDGTPLARLVAKAADELADLSPYAEQDDLKFRRLRRQSVKGYKHLEPWSVRRAKWRTRDQDESE